MVQIKSKYQLECRTVSLKASAHCGTFPVGLSTPGCPSPTHGHYRQTDRNNNTSPVCTTHTHYITVGNYTKNILTAFTLLILLNTCESVSKYYMVRSLL